MPFCLRTSRSESDIGCTTIIVATERSEDLRVCRNCPAGVAIMAAAQFGRRVPVAALPAAEPPPPPPCEPRPAATAQTGEMDKFRNLAISHPEYLTRTLRYLIPRHKKDKHFGIRFLSMVAGQFGFAGDAAAFQGACDAAGLNTFKKGALLALRVDERLHAFISEEAS